MGDEYERCGVDRTVSGRRCGGVQHAGTALGALPEAQRAVIVLKEFQGLTFDEIAEALDVSPNTAKSRMYYGLKGLRKIFEQWHIDEEAVRYDV